jgi:hypothetical protein
MSLDNTTAEKSTFKILDVVQGLTVRSYLLPCRQYNRLVKSIKPDMEQYERQKQKMGGAFCGGRNTILQGLHKDTKEGIDHMIQDLEKQ